jgi:hypothetical protein
MEHFVDGYLHAGFANVPLVFSEWGINYNQGSSPWGQRGNWAFSLVEADMMLYALELGEKGIVDQSSKHILSTDFGHGFFTWKDTQFVERPSGAWFLKFVEAARGGYSVRVNVSATMLDPELGVSSLSAVAFRKTGEYNVLMVNKFDQSAAVKITINSGGNNQRRSGCEVESLSLDLTDNPVYALGSDVFSAPLSFDCESVSVPKLSVTVIRVVVPTCADVDGSGGKFSGCGAGTALNENADDVSCYSGTCTALDCCAEVESKPELGIDAHSKALKTLTTKYDCDLGAANLVGTLKEVTSKILPLRKPLQRLALIFRPATKQTSRPS